MKSLKKLWPKHSLSDKIAFSFTHFGLIGIALFEIFVVLPIYHKPFSFMYCLQLLIGIYLAFQVFSNLYTLITIDSSVKSHMNLPCVLLPGWTYCNVCEMNAPPRSHHCPVCNICILKRDHHCIFSGNCVSFGNHRYFMMMVLYLWIGSLYAIHYNMAFYVSILGNINFSLLLKLVFPMLAWTFGFIKIYQLFITIVMGFHLLAMFLFTALACFQIFFISSGQTQFECRQKVNDYSRGFKNNWLLVLGDRWYLTWIGPFMTSSLPGDGTEYEKSILAMSPVERNVKIL